MSHKAIAVLLIYALSLPKVPNDPPHPPEQESGIAFDSLGCTCSKTLRNALQCSVLPAFGDNEWEHQGAKKFAIQAKDFAATLETATEDIKGNYYLALQGWADRRQIRINKKWGQASPKCRVGHQLTDPVTNRDLAFLRACELRQVMRDSFIREIELLPPVDFTNPQNRPSERETYSGAPYKAAVLFVIFPDRSVCGHEKQFAKRGSIRGSRAGG